MSGSVCVGVPYQCGYGGVVSLCSLKHGPINIRLSIYLCSYISVYEYMYVRTDIHTDV